MNFLSDICSQEADVGLDKSSVMDMLTLREQKYQLSARLGSHAGPINCFAFTQDGEYLASGGKL